MNKQRYLLVVSGPSGAGKDTVVSRMMQKHPEIEISVSATTRAPRAGETDGENYYFLTNEQFEAKIDRGEMLEYVNYCGKYYGTPKSEVDARLDRGTTVVLVIEVVGAANIKKLYRKARSFSSCRPVWTSCAPACAAAGQRAKRRLPAGSSGQRKNCPMPESMIFRWRTAMWTHARTRSTVF